jgi:hypothetical protein
MLGRWITILVVAMLAAPSIALSQPASPKDRACRAEAAERYIESFRKIGPRQSDVTENRVMVTSFGNDTSRYQAFLDECLARWNSMKAR